jgi:hypothetical protein
MLQEFQLHKELQQTGLNARSLQSRDLLKTTYEANIFFMIFKCLVFYNLLKNYLDSLEILFHYLKLKNLFWEFMHTCSS